MFFLHHSNRYDSRARGFTLVEVLVVMAIIGILVATLIPYLESARIEARRVATGSNIRQLSIVFTSYGADNKGSYPTLRRPLWSSWGCFAPGNNVNDRTAFNAVRNYGGLPATAHPAAGSPSWNKSYLGGETPGQPSAPGAGYNSTWTNGDWDWMNGYASPYFLAFGYNNQSYGGYNWGNTTTRWLGTPSRIERMTPAHNLVGDRTYSKWRGGSPTSRDYYFNHPRRSGLRRVLNYAWDVNDQSVMAFNPCDQAYNATFEFIAGAYMGKADGAVVWYGHQSLPRAQAGVTIALPAEGLIWKWYWAEWAQVGAGDF